VIWRSRQIIKQPHYYFGQGEDVGLATSGIDNKKAISHVRWIVVALLFWVSMSNFLDRSVFGNLAPEMPKYLHLADNVKPAAVDQYWKAHAADVQTGAGVSQQQAARDAVAMVKAQTYIKSQIAKSTWGEWYWNINTAFSAAYALSMLFMGRLMDVWGLRWGFATAITVWMLAEVLHAAAPEIGGVFGSAIIGFFICRILLGLGEGGVSPAVNKSIAEWFPKKERALAVGIAAGASSIGGVLAPWLLPALLTLFTSGTIAGVVLGWRGLFVLTGAVDILLLIIWAIYYRDPAHHSGVSSAELAYIQSDSAVETKVKIPWRKLVPHRQTWAFICAKSLTDGFWWFYLFGSPDFFARKFNLGPADRQYMLVTIYLISAVGAVIGGWLSGRFMKLGWSINLARKVTMLVCAVAAAPVFYAAFTSQRWVAVALIALAASGHQAWGANVMCLPGDMFPKRTVGSLTGIAGVCSTTVSMLLMFLIGQVVSRTGSYLSIFCMASAAYPVALVLSHLLAPKLEQARVEEEENQVVLQSSLWSFDGRIGRGQFWIRNIAASVIIAVVAWLLGDMMNVTAIKGLAILLSLLFGIAAFFFCLATQTKRWHDLGWTGLMALWNLTIIFIPIAFVWLGFIHGAEGANKHGAKPAH
jgi:ACS family hexuronate transporter-like MFS transporter